MRRIASTLALLFLSASLASIAAGCTRQDICADVMPNATVTDVLYDESDNRLYVSLYHSLSYCTGTDEKRFSNELIDISLDNGQASFMHRDSDRLNSYPVPDVCCPLYRDGAFTNSTNCVGCELILNDPNGIYTFRFVTNEDWEFPMVLYITRDATPLLTVDIGSYTSSERPPER